MAGIKIDNFGTGNVKLSAIMLTEQAMLQGHFKAVLTNMETTGLPVLSNGSIIEVNGSLIYVNDDEAITGSAVDGVNYIKISYEASILTVVWTQTAPVFDVTKNGWYGTGGSSGHRYIARMMKSITSYTYKKYYDAQEYMPVFESKLASASLSMGSGAFTYAVLTFASPVKSIHNFTFNGGDEDGSGAQYYLRIVGLTIASNVVTVALQNVRGITVTMEYSILITAEL